MRKLKGKEYKRFEDIKHIREDGSEYWSARELAPALEYTQWRNFSKVIGRAMIACENSGHNVLDDFAEVSKIVEAGATSKPIKDYELTRYACYLIVQNGDPRKEVIALGQTYFAIQTYRQEFAARLCRCDKEEEINMIENHGYELYPMPATDICLVKKELESKEISFTVSPEYKW